MPSLTETLLEAGAQLVGRTRFCIHPAGQVKRIPIVGGTKQVNWQRVAELKPDLVVMDKEENTKEMADACPHPWHATHVTSVDSVAPELAALADTLASQALRRQAEAWRRLAAQPALPAPRFEQLPGLLELLAPPKNPTRIEYLIWRDPWMAIGPQTFIASVLAKTGFADYLPPHKEPYPTLADAALQREDTFYLLSSEPYPFPRQAKALRGKFPQAALVDGEFFSWFGARTQAHLSAYLAKALP